MDKRNVILAVLFVVLAAVVYYAVSYEPLESEGLVFGSVNITAQEGADRIVGAKTVAVVMDVRGITQKNAVEVFQCGTGFAQSLGQMNKTVANFAVEESGCIGPEINSIGFDECNALIHGNDYVILVRGTGGVPVVQYYGDHFYVEVPENNMRECKFVVK